MGYAVDATVENGVWTRQNPVFDSPLNLGAHCAKGASLREHGHGEYRLKTPMKLVNGKGVKMSWEDAINEVGDRLSALRKESGPDSVFFVGSSKQSNEQAYLLRKFVSYWGTNNCDHQARICHSTTVAGVASTKDAAAAEVAKAQQAKAEDRVASRYIAEQKAKGVVVTPQMPAAAPASAAPAKPADAKAVVKAPAAAPAAAPAKK